MADDDVPPLEDMSELLQQVERLREFKQPSQTSTSTKEVKPTIIKENAKPVVEATSHSNTNSSKQPEPTGNEKDPGFGGFRKGFLLGGASSAKKKPVAAKPKTNDIPLIKPKNTQDDIPLIKPKNKDVQENQFEIPEVQDAMKAQQKLLDKTDWVTDDLLLKIAQNKNLMKRLQDPVFMQAIAEFQSDSTKALAKYKDNPSIMEFFKETCGILGDHFSTLTVAEDESEPQKPEVQPLITESADMKAHRGSSGVSPRQPTPEDEQKMAEILSRPDVRSALEDAKVQELIAALRANPAKAQSMIQNACPDFYKNVKTLVDNGLLAIQR